MGMQQAVPGDPVLTRMRSMCSAWKEAGDRRCIFLEAYALMTERMSEAIGESRFEDGPWVRSLLDGFAGYYFDAVERFDTGDPATPQVWDLALSAAARPELGVLQHLFLGINAHINYDLALALADLLEAEWDRLDEDGRARRLHDHRLVDAIIESTVDEVQTEVVAARSPLLALVDRALGPVDEWAFARMIAGWRGDAWARAVDIVIASPAERAPVVSRLEEEAVDRARLLLLDGRRLSERR